MNLIPGQCMICKQNEQVLKTAEVRPFLKYIINTYFVNNKIGVKELKYRTSPKSLCVVCACNVETSFKFKKTYEDKMKKESTIKKTRACCLVCGFRGFGLVKTEDNPNEFEENVQIFMKTISKVRPYKQCAVCFVCVLELQNFNKINAVLQEEIELSNSKIKQIVLSEEEDLQIVPSVQSTPKKQHSSPIKSSLRNKRKRSPTEEIPAAKRSKMDSSKQLLNKYSPDVKSVKALRETETINIPRTIVRDKKMYSNLPYIKVENAKLETINSKITRGKPAEEEDSNNQKPKVSIRIKLLAKKRNSKPCPQSRKNVNKCKECKEIFTSPCQFKSHLLMHEKPQLLKIDLIRDPSIPRLIMESQKGKNEDIVEQKEEGKKGDEECEEGNENEEASGESQELAEEPNSEAVVDITESDSAQGCVSDVIDNKDKVDQEEADNEEMETEESDKSYATPDTLEGGIDKNEWVVVDEVVNDTNIHEEEEEESNKETEEDLSQEVLGVSGEIVEDIVAKVNGEAETADEEKETENEEEEKETEDEEKENENEEKEDKGVEGPVIDSEENNKETEEQKKSDENGERNSEDTNEEYHDADDEINLSLSESDKCSEKSVLNEQTTKDLLDLEENEEQIEKSSEDISDNDKRKVFEMSLEKKLRMILGEDSSNIPEKIPSNSQEKDDAIWDAACSEKSVFNTSTLNTTILKKTTKKSEESPKCTKKVRFIVDSDIVEEESNVNNKNNHEPASEVETFSHEELICNE